MLMKNIQHTHTHTYFAWKHTYVQLWVWALFCFVMPSHWAFRRPFFFEWLIVVGVCCCRLWMQRIEYCPVTMVKPTHNLICAIISRWRQYIQINTNHLENCKQFMVFSTYAICSESIATNNRSIKMFLNKEKKNIYRPAFFFCALYYKVDSVFMAIYCPGR